MIWRYLQIVEAVDFELLKWGSEPFLAALPAVTLSLHQGAFAIALVDGEFPFDGTFDASRREILLWRPTRCLKLVMAHELGHLIYAYGVPAEDREGHWRDAVERTQVFQYLKETEETGRALALSDTAEQIELASDSVEVEYLLRWDEIFARAVAQYVAWESGDLEMLTEIEERARPQVGSPF